GRGEQLGRARSEVPWQLVGVAVEHHMRSQLKLINFLNQSLGLVAFAYYVQGRLLAAAYQLGNDLQRGGDILIRGQRTGGNQIQRTALRYRGLYRRSVEWVGNDKGRVGFTEAVNISLALGTGQEDEPIPG